MRSDLILVALLLSCFLGFSQNDVRDKLNSKSIPNWVNRIGVSKSMAVNDYEDHGEASYLLVDHQTNFMTEEAYHKFAIRLNNESGVQNNSELWFSFDPSYQELSIHSIQIIRDGKSIDCLNLNKIELVRNEKNADRFIYDGLYSAMMILEDIRIDDILVYEYTTKGRNPLYNDLVMGEYQFTFNVEIVRYHISFLIDAGREIYSKNFNNCPDPAIHQIGQTTMYEWDLSNIAPVYVDSDVPGWYHVYATYYISEFESWSEVVEWASELYPFYESYDIHLYRVVEEIAGRGSKKEQVLNLVRFVQNEIRYLGIESGVNGMKPNPPVEVLNQRFGDCKDKSYLLVTMLRVIGIKADVALVNTYLKKYVANQLPSPFAFNHAIAKFQLEGIDYWIDPTLSQQGGSLDNSYFPDYGKALVLSSDYNSPIDVEGTDKERIEIRELYYARDSVTAIQFTVRSRYFGSEANNMRSSFSNTPLDKLKNHFLDYYSTYYPTIKMKENGLIVKDDKNNNILSIEEYYEIPDAWSKMDATSNELYFQFETVNLVNFLSDSQDRLRKMPLQIYYPIEIDYQIELTMPLHKNITVDQSHKEIISEGFRFTKDVKAIGNTVLHKYKYIALKDFVEAADCEIYFKKLDETYELCADLYTWGMGISGYRTNWLLVIVLFFVFIPVIMFLRYLYRYNRSNNVNLGEDPIPIGGWLVFPVIGLIISPFIIGWQIYNIGFFNLNLWETIFSSTVYDSMSVAILTGAEVFFNLLFILINIFLVILLVKKRNIFPRIFIGYQTLFLIVIILDVYFSNLLIGMTTAEESKLIIRAVVGAAIWIPYFLKSERVKKTFVMSYVNKPIKGE